MSIIIFFGQFFWKMMKQFLEDINQGIYYTLCLKLHLPKRIYPQRISEFKMTIGKDRMAAIIQEIKEYLYINLEPYKVDDDLIEFVALGVSLSVNLSGIYNHYGFSKFLNSTFWHGLFAELETCIARQRQQKKYSLTDLLFTYLSKLVEHGDMGDLEKELKNSIEGGYYLNSKNLYEPFHSCHYVTFKDKVSNSKKSESVDLTREQQQLLRELDIKVTMPEK